MTISNEEYQRQLDELEFKLFSLLRILLKKKQLMPVEPRLQTWKR
jgi:hypothetical protein